MRLAAVLNPRRLLRRPRLPRDASLSFLLSWSLGLAVILISLACGAFALRNFRQEKTRDTLAIMYLDLERIALGIEREARALGNAAGGTSFEIGAGALPPDVIARLDGQKIAAPVRGKLPPDAEMPRPVTGAVIAAGERSILQFGGQDYLARVVGEGEASRRFGSALPKGRYLVLWRTNVAEWVGAVAGRDGVSRLYVVTREAALLFSNSDKISASDFYRRPLVKQYIEAPLRLGQVTFTVDGEDWYGFFFDVPGTNMIAFAEAPRATALAPVRAAVLRFVLLMATSLLLALVLLQFFLGIITAPLTRLMQLTKQVAAGVFDVNFQPSGCREIKDLSVSFVSMSGSLAQRDARIQALMLEQAKKSRMEAELEIARTVQLRLLPQEALPAKAGLDLGVCYTPMTELAGDWYGHAISDDGLRTTVALADIAGHGAGSAMFMTLIAGAFEELRLTDGGAPSPAVFIEKTHTLIKAVGKSSAHATMLVIRFDRETRELEVCNAGHTFPILTTQDGGQPEVLKMPSMIVGHFDLAVATRRIKLERGHALTIYSDGLVEAHNAANKRFGPRRLLDACKNGRGAAQDRAEAISASWRAHLGATLADDDCCIMVARAL